MVIYDFHLDITTNNFPWSKNARRVEVTEDLWSDGDAAWHLASHWDMTSGVTSGSSGLQLRFSK